MYLFGTNEYIKRIVTQYSGLLLRIAYTRLKCTADAEDVVQDVFLKLLAKNPHFRNEEHEKAWLIRTTINLSCDMLKCGNRKTVPLDEKAALEPEEPPQLLLFVQNLPAKYSTVIHLYFYEGYSIKEISKILGLPAATVGTRLARAKARLKLLLEEEENYEPKQL